ncbi:TPA: AAA family ATPase [Bacillus paranthracis]|uniref:AAA family ATPase n=1 Tax=Bacillus cereus group sp. MYBK101-2 TaxID=3450700 RepID=UPI0032F1E9FA|nr:AAA family ATPase [Bacillus paranthracis]
MKYKISEVYIENFKSIKRSHLQFEDKSLSILDGPNGFGKTSIFDAIELLLTGSIRRVSEIKIVDGNKGYNDYLFAKQQDVPIVVKIKIYDAEKNEEFIFGRKIDHSHLNKRQKKPGEFPSSLHLLNDINDELVNKNRTNINLDEVFCRKDFSNTYGLYHYVEQEECTHLFKKTENDRMTAISKLFNIEKEESERRKITKIKNKILANKNKLNNRIMDLEKDLDLSVLKEENEGKVNYIQLLPDIVSRKIYWDSKNLKSFSLEQKIEWFSQIEGISYLITNLDLFKSAYKNEKINLSINNKKRIEEVLVLYNLKEKIEILKEEYKLKQQLNGFLKLLEEKDILNGKIYWESIYKYFNLPIPLESLMDKLDIIRKLKNNSTEFSRMITNLLNTRIRLTKCFEELMNDSEQKDRKCPLCGAKWKNYEDLLTQISEQTKFYQNQQDHSSREESFKIMELYDNYVNQLIQNIKNYINLLVSDDLYYTLEPYFDKKVDKSRVNKFFKEIGINIENYVYDELNSLDDLTSRTEQLIEKLKGELQGTGDFDYEQYIALKDMYENVFEKDENLLFEIDLKKFKLKKDYINYIYYIQSNIKYQKYIDLKSKYEMITSAYETVSETLSIYNKNIETYRTKMIKAVEIPFYIYSGKIIQNYQRGIGVFIKEDEGKEEQIKTIRFVPPQKTDHDIVHTFSSGQLSATVLAFTLALNKVYNNSGLNTILIDDPIQTMDEMNMASFVELLRNEFGEKQIILSTHENHISLYMRYKFSKYGYKTQKLNVKELLYN